MPADLSIGLKQADLRDLATAVSELTDTSKKLDGVRLAAIAGQIEKAAILLENALPALERSAEARLGRSLTPEEKLALRANVQTVQGAAKGFSEGFQTGAVIGGPHVGLALGITAAVGAGLTARYNEIERKRVDAELAEVRNRIYAMEEATRRLDSELKSVRDGRVERQRRLDRARRSAGLRLVQ